MITRGSFYEVLELLNADYEGNFVLGVDTSARMLGLTNVREFPITVLATSDALEDFSHPNIEIVGTIAMPQSNEITVVNGYRCTNVERTLVDLLHYERNPQVIVESLAYYFQSIGTPEDWGNLPQVMRQHGVYEDFETYIEDAEEYYYN